MNLISCKTEINANSGDALSASQRAAHGHTSDRSQTCAVNFSKNATSAMHTLAHCRSSCLQQFHRGNFCFDTKKMNTVLTGCARLCSFIRIRSSSRHIILIRYYVVNLSSFTRIKHLPKKYFYAICSTFCCE